MKTRLAILEYPDPRLLRVAAPVGRIDESLRRLMDDMSTTLRETSSIGLAAPQVDVHQRLIVVDVSEGREEPMVLVNPEIVSRALPGMSEERCLSVPGYVGAVPRDLRIEVRAQDRDGRPLEMEAEGLLAVCIQHEIDHLDGRLFISRLPWLKRMIARQKLGARRVPAQAAV